MTYPKSTPLASTRFNLHGAAEAESIVALERRDFLRLLGVGAVSALIASCGDRGGSAGPTESSRRFRISLNGTDPRLLRALTGDGRSIDYYGARDPSGRPVVVDFVEINGGVVGPLRYLLAPDGRPTTMLDPGGTVFQLRWISPTAAALTVLMPNSEGQLNTLVDFAKQGAVGSIAALDGPSSLEGGQGAARVAARPQARHGRRIVLIDESPRVAPMTAGVASQMLTPNVAIRVMQCGLAATGLGVFVEVEDATVIPGVSLGTYWAREASAGTYLITIPTNVAPSLNPAHVCAATADAVGKICDWIEPIPHAPTALCATVSAALAASGYGTALATAVGAACMRAAAGLVLYCDTLDFGPVPGSPSLADEICKAPELDRTFVGRIRLIPFALALPRKFQGPALIAPGQGPFPELRVDLGSTTTISSLTLVPPNPVAEQGYRATSGIFCLPAGTRVTLSILGTDGYSDAVTTQVPVTRPNGSFTLFVPGADSAGIRDMVTVTVLPPNGAPLTRTASLVFG